MLIPVAGEPAGASGTKVAPTRSVAPASGTAYVPLVPFRLADTRCAARPGPVPPSFCSEEHLPTANALLRPPTAGGSISFQAGGAGPSGGGAGSTPAGVNPATPAITAISPDATSVVLNITAVVEPGLRSASGELIAYPAGGKVPSEPTVRFAVRSGAVVPALTTVAVGKGGRISVFSSSAGVDVVVDAEGYYVPSVPASDPDAFVPLATPVTALDTLCYPSKAVPPTCAAERVDPLNVGTPAVVPGGTTAVSIAGAGGDATLEAGGVPPSGVVAASVVATVSDPVMGGYLTLWPAGGGRAVTSVLNFVKGVTAINSGIVGLGQGGGLDVFNSAGRAVNVRIIVTGYFTSQPDASCWPSCPEQDPASIRFGVTPGEFSYAGYLGVPAGSMVEPDESGARLVSLAAGNPFTVHMYVGWQSGVPSPLVQSINSYVAMGFSINLALRYGSPVVAGDSAAFAAWVQEMVKALPQVQIFQVTNEANVGLSTDSDGYWPGADNALVAGVEAAAQVKQPDQVVGFNFAYEPGAGPNTRFFDALARIGGAAFSRDVGFVGVDLYPGTYAMLPPQPSGAAFHLGQLMYQVMTSELSNLRDHLMPAIGAGPSVPIFVQEAGWADFNPPSSSNPKIASAQKAITAIFNLMGDNQPRSELDQAEVLSAMISSLAGYGVGLFQWFDLTDSTNGVGDGWGLLSTNYDPKPAYYALQQAVADAARPPGPYTGAPVEPVSHVGRWLVDATGRVLLLHGVNMVEKQVPYYPAAFGFGPADAAWLAENGFDVVRLGLLPTGALPGPGEVSQAYMDHLAQTVDQLSADGIMTLLDVHQDGWGPAVGAPGSEDGFPAWMTVTGNAVDNHLGFPYYYAGDPATQQAFQSFWDNVDGPNGVPLQQDYANMMSLAAEDLGGKPSILGYELMNEPWPGTNWVACYDAGGCPSLDSSEMAPFEARGDAAVRSGDGTHLVFAEPWVTFNMGTSKTSIPLPGGDPESGLAFHLYPGNVLAGLNSAVANAESWSAKTGGALLVTEWMGNDNPATIDSFAASLDSALVPWIFWSFDGGMVGSVADPPTGSNLHTAVVDAVVRPHPLAVAGTPQKLSYDPSTHVLSFTWSTAPVGGGSFPPGAVTSVQLPTLDEPNGYVVQAEGATVTSPPCSPMLTLTAAPGAKMASITVEPAPAGYSCG